MRKLKLFNKSIVEWGNPVVPTVVDEEVLDHKTPITLPSQGGRSSEPSLDTSTFTSLRKFMNEVRPGFLFEVIPIIRKLAMANSDVGQAVDNVVTLANTGHKIRFDQEVDEKQANLMRRHLDRKRLEWAEGTAGMDGLINKMIAQVMIGGAISNEWVPNMDLTGIQRVALVNPENIRFVYNTQENRFEAFQRPKHLVGISNIGVDGLVKLNPHTFKYYGIGGDTEIPYGIPPYIAALDSIVTQRVMVDNIKYVVEQMGIMGFLELLMEKPEMQHNESDAAYTQRLETTLDAAKVRVLEGLRDGTTVGYDEDHEFKFHKTNKSPGGVNELWQNNELQVISGLKQDAALLGRSYGTSDTAMTVVFTKLLSQLKNVQNIVGRNIEFGYALELRLAGFDFNTLTVEFNQSTVRDELKHQQGEEIRIRNGIALYNQGLVSQQQLAVMLGFEKPDQDEPRETIDPAGDAAATEPRKQQKKADKKKKIRKDSEPSAKVND